jgi:Protein of unknown function (DUF2892)
MRADRLLRLMAGSIVLLSVALGVFVHPGFLWVTLLVGANLFQSAFSNWCPLMAITSQGKLAGVTTA